jgi:hypothetical protein
MAGLRCDGRTMDQLVCFVNLLIVPRLFQAGAVPEARGVAWPLSAA